MYFNENISKKKIGENAEKATAHTLPNDKNVLDDKE